MLEALRLATILSLVLAIVLVIARGQPLLRVVKPHYDALGPDLRYFVCTLLGVAILGGWLNQHTAGGATVLAVSWAGGLVYFWATLISDLRAGS